MAWSGLNRRKFPRVVYPCLIKMISKNKEIETFLTHTENVGIGGVCVIVKNEIKLFTEVEVEIDLMDAEEHIKAPARIVWVVRRKATEDVKPTFYDLGIEFVDLPSRQKDHLTAVIDRVVKNGAKVLKVIN